MPEKNKNIPNQYIGPNKVVGIVENELKTPMGHEIVEIVFESIPKILMPKKAFDLLSRNTPMDYTSYTKMKVELIGRELVALIMEYDIRNLEMVILMKFTADLMQDAFERASNFLWTGDDKQWISGMSFLNERTLLEAERVIKRIKNDDNKASEESGK